MAEKVIGLRINVIGTDDAVKKLSNIEIALEKSKAEVRELEKQFKAALGKGAQAEAEAIRENINNIKIAQKQLANEAKATRKEIDQQQKAFASANAAAGSYEQLNGQLQLLRKEFRALSKEEAQGEVGKALIKNIQAINDNLVEQDERLGVFTRKVGDYENAVVRALRRAASEDALTKQLQEVNDETEALRAENKKLVQSYEQVKLAGGDVNAITKQLVENDQQIERNTKSARELADALKDAKALGDQQGAGAGRGVGRRQLSAVGRLAGGAGQVVGNLAGDLLGGAQAFQSFGAAAVPAFAVFAAGGLALKGLAALEGLSKEFGQLEAKVGSFGNLSGQALKKATVDVKALATTFGKENDDIIKATGALAKNLGVDFNTALAKLEQGFLTGADASGELLGALEGAAEGARAAGLSVDDLIVFSNEATQSGLLSERGLELVNEFGKNIKSNSEEARTALQGALGKEFTDELFTNVQNGSLSTKDAIQQVSVELGKQGVSAKEAAKVFTDAFGAQTAAENEFILSLNDTRKGIGDYISEANRLTNVQKEQLAANKELASAQQGLAGTFESFGFSLEALGTRIKASLLNAANSAILFFNKTFGDGVAAAREEFRKLSIALEEQKGVVAGLETNYEPLLKRYDELTATLPTLKEGSDEAKAAQTELRDIVQKVGEAIPAAKKGIDGYSTSLTLNAEAARGYIQSQRDIERNLQLAQFDVVTKQITNLTRKIQNSENILKRGTLPADRLIETNQRLAQYRKELAELQGFLANSTFAEDTQRILGDFAGINTAIQNQTGTAKAAAEEAAKAQKEASDKAAADKKKADDAAQAQANKAAQERAKAAAEKAKQERERLLEEEKRTREALQDATTQTNNAITQLKIEGIQNEAEREEAAIKENFAQRVITESEGLRNAAEARVKTLEDIKAKVGSDAVLRAQFGSAEEVQKKIDEVNAAAISQIEAQTTLLTQARDKQLKTLSDSRKKAVEEAAKSLDAEALAAGIQEVQQRLQVTQGDISAIELQFGIDEQKLDQQAAQAQARLRGARAAGLITERQFAEESRAIAQKAEADRIALIVKRIDAERALLQKQAEQQKLIIEGERLSQLDSIDRGLTEREALLNEQLQKQLISEEQYQIALQGARESAAQNRLLTEQIATQEIEAVNDEFRAAEISAQGEVATATAELYAGTLEAYKENQQAILEELSQAINTAAEFALGAIDIVEQFSQASEARRREEIQQRYDAELAAAQGNQRQIENIERRRAQEEERLDKQAAARRKQIAIAQAIINGAVAVTNILATTPDPTGAFTAARIVLAGITTAAQIAVISAQEFEKGGSIPAGDGLVTGQTHAQGGVRGVINGKAVEVEGGEWKAFDEFGNAVLINRRSTAAHRATLAATANKSFDGKRELLSRINEWGGGVRFAQGGIVPAPSIPQNAVAAQAGQMQAMQQMIQQQYEATLQLAQAINARIDRLTVVIDPQEALEEGLKSNEIKKTQVLGG